MSTSGLPNAELHQMASIGRLLAGIVHEINTPIGSIFSNNDVVAKSLASLKTLLEDPSEESRQRAMQIVETCQTLVAVDKIACERIRSVIRGLKTFSRVDSFEIRNVNLNETLRDTLKLTQAEFRGRITVETDFGELPEVECHPQMLSQVFLNLLVNAAQAIDGEGKIKVRTWLEGDHVAISISDTGRGMTPEQQARVFQAGFTTKPVGIGTGLGLPIAKQIVEERHGGIIRFHSEPGVGTTFHLHIPVRHTRRPNQ
ncbi:MAG TPA: HAMP domain-containing sensor histidine kinase [Bryobacteraceae bacterium]|nr:HAMP domain-containing sensor histidine kinase [Bryobacteraceae bacterium]